MESHQDTIFPIIYQGLIFLEQKQRQWEYILEKKREFLRFLGQVTSQCHSSSCCKTAPLVGFLLPVDDLIMCSCGMWREREAICGFPINSVLILGSKESANFILFSLGPKKEGNVMRHFGKFFLYSSSDFSPELLHWCWQKYAGWIKMIEKAILTECLCHSLVLPSENGNYRSITMSVVNKMFALK